MNNSTKRHAVLSIDDDSEDDDGEEKVEIYKCNDDNTNSQRIDYLKKWISLLLR